MVHSSSAIGKRIHGSEDVMDVKVEQLADTSACSNFNKGKTRSTKQKKKSPRKSKLEDETRSEENEMETEPLTNLRRSTRLTGGNMRLFNAYEKITDFSGCFKRKTRSTKQKKKLARKSKLEDESTQDETRFEEKEIETESLTNLRRSKRRHVTGCNMRHVYAYETITDFSGCKFKVQKIVNTEKINNELANFTAQFWNNYWNKNARKGCLQLNKTT